MIRSIRAFLLIATVLASYGLQWLFSRATFGRLSGNRWERVHRANADRLLWGFTRLRGMFIKLGQVISVLGGFLPDVYRQRLDALQDRVPARPFSEIEGRLEEAFGAKPLERFVTFEREPIAAASLAQVHRATLQDGSAVAVKVLYPGIERMITRDLFVFRLFLPLINRVFPVVRFDRVLSQLSAMMRRETDFGSESRNMHRLAAIFADREDVVVPSAVSELTRKGVLTMSFESGLKVTDLGALRQAGIEPEGVARLVSEAYFTMLFEHRVLHADPHPGNFLVRPGPTLVILDHGAVESLEESLVEGLHTVIGGALTRNSDQLLEGVEQMGFVAPGGDRKLLREVGREYLAALSEVRISDYSSFDQSEVRKLSAYPHLRGRLREVLRNVEYPESYFYVERTLALLFGLVGQLDPKRGLPGVAAPLASKVMLRRLARPSAPTEFRGEIANKRARAVPPR